MLALYLNAFAVLVCDTWDTKNSLPVPEFPLCLPLKSSINGEKISMNLTYGDKA